VTCFWGDPSCYIETPSYIFYEEVFEQKWYQKGLLVALLEESHKEYLQVSFQAYSALMHHHEQQPQEPWRSSWLQDRDVEQSAPTNARHTHCASRQLDTTADRRCDIPWDWLWDSCQMTRVCWGTRCEGFCCKEGTQNCIEQSARNPLERDQVQRVPEKSSSSCCQTSNNQSLFMSLKIPWGFLAQAVLRWLSGGLWHVRRCQFEDFEWEETVWFAITQQTFAWETFGKRRNGERKPVLILIPGSHERLAFRKCIMCARNMGAHLQHGTWRTKGIKKWDKNWIPMQPRKARRN
jgi:hypothetical protein